jgi:hypothetical protein
MEKTMRTAPNMFKKAASALLAGGMILAAATAHAEPPKPAPGHDRPLVSRGHDDAHRGDNHRPQARNDHRGWNDRRDYGRNYHGSSHSSFSFSYVVAPRPVYYSQPYYAQPYYAQPYYPAAYQPPVNAAPIQYTTPAQLDDSGQYCREYTRDVIVGGRVQSSYGTACLQPDGDWEIQS